MLTYADLAGIPVVMAARGINEAVDSVHDDLEQRGHKIITVDSYDLSSVILCMTKQYGLLVPDVANPLFAELVSIPVQWNQTTPCGFFKIQNPDGAVKKLADFLRNGLKGNHRYAKF